MTSLDFFCPPTHEHMHEPYEVKLGRIHDFKVKYRLYRPEEGGRKTGVTYQGIRYDFSYENQGKKDAELYMIWPEFENEYGEIITDDDEPVREMGTARMWIVTDHMRVIHKEKIVLGTKGFMMEANRVMGECQVIEI